MKKILIGALLASALTATAASAYVSSALSLNQTTGDSLANGPFTLGWNFTVLQTITVDGLGAFDSSQDGLAQSHDVGIWDNAGTLITSQTVPNGTLGTLAGAFRYVRASAVLTPGDYRIGATWLDGADPLVFSGTGITTISQIRYTGGNFVSGAALAFPGGNGAGDAYFGPNFSVAVPEPATWGLMITGFGLVGFSMRRRATAVAA